MAAKNEPEPSSRAAEVQELTASSAIVKVHTRTRGVVGFIVPTQSLFPNGNGKSNGGSTNRSSDVSVPSAVASPQPS